MSIEDRTEEQRLMISISSSSATETKTKIYLSVDTLSKTGFKEDNLSHCKDAAHKMTVFTEKFSCVD